MKKSLKNELIGVLCHTEENGLFTMCSGGQRLSEQEVRSDQRYDSAPTGCSPLLRVIISLCIGLLFCILGVVSYTTFAPILEQQVKANLVIDPSNEVFESWQEPPITINVKMYLFNYTNPEKILAGLKPTVNELGPFVYRERRQKVNITFNGNGTVSYRQIVSYDFLPHLSVGNLDDELFTLNVPMIGSAYKNRKALLNEESMMAHTIEELFEKHNQTFLIQRKVRELLFEGYQDPLLRVAKEMGWSSSTRFGYQVNRNNSDDGIYTIYTGEEGMENYGTVDSWDGKKRVLAFRRSCSFINGTTGEMWPPYTLTRQTPLVFFVSPICRSLRLDFLCNETVKGIRALRYHLSQRLFDYSIKENQCFCTKKKGKDPECFPNGLLDLNRCQPDAPIVASLPHHLYAASSVSEAVDGLSPDPELHEFFMDVEPTMGIPLRVSARLQLNVIVDAFKYFKQFQVFKKRVFLPTFWTETTAMINDDIAFKIRLVTEDLANYVTFAALAWVLIGLIVIICTFGYVIAYTRRSKQEKRPSSSGYAAVKMIATTRLA
ncbi:scavenger receptor class B member 1-like [Varroa jacobsoni]|uniref:scavenger receptor class B member 1-like n=1 Tax=Varroa jacobsoni TaxID=62625 RepID=UPI000BF76FC2|nr:scavenger receptor class B member 1-like [Varroa jacobsoni]